MHLLGVPTGSDVGSRNTETLATAASAVTVVRTVVAVALAGAGVVTERLDLLIASLAVYWVGDMLDGLVARLRDTETRVGALLDIFCDRLCAAVFYVPLAALSPEVAIPALLYLANFVVVDCLLSISFLAWSIRSPNYFYAVDERLWRWNWSPPAKAVNSALFAVLLLTTGSVVLGTVVALGLLALKVVSLARLLRLGMPVPGESGT